MLYWFTGASAGSGVAALMQAPVTYVWTHDSIGLGEDGPTHQPVEHLWALRGIPGLDIVRPADANETAAAWLQILKNTDRPKYFSAPVQLQMYKDAMALKEDFEA